VVLSYRKESQLTKRKRKKQSLHIHDKECKVLMESHKVQQRWKEYWGFA